MSQELSPKIQNALTILQSHYPKTETNRGNIYVFDGLILHIVEERNNELKVSSTLNLHYKGLLPFLIIFGIMFGIIGVALVFAVAKIATIKPKKTKNAKIISLISDAESIKDN